ncbi:MAG: NAD(P)-dependent alcohol dehydrogenase [Gammaproteobacteria bacterium]|nr:NAD(P)-dependent alcohol dehydrogenase [Gammaproteobacteria bacterium]
MIKAFAAMEAGAELQPFEYNPGELSFDEIEIDVQHCGVCHSDISMINNEWGMSSYPIVPGHEVIGTIAALGEQVKHLKVGERVGLGWHSAYCTTCHNCMSGDHNLCSTATGTIVKHHGGFADKVRAQAISAVPLPDGIDAAKAGPLFCGGATVFNPLMQFAIKPTDKVGVIGIGGLGHMALQFCNAWGCEVTAFTSSDNKCDEALAMGAHHTINSRNSDQINKAAGRFDLILSTVNVKLDWSLYIRTLAKKGRLHFLGVALEPFDLSVTQLMANQNSISSSLVSSPAIISEMLRFAARHNINPKTEHFKFEDINKAIAHLENGDARYRVVLSR